MNDSTLSSKVRMLHPQQPPDFLNEKLEGGDAFLPRHGVRSGLVICGFILKGKTTDAGSIAAQG